jgi:hypothetical protein
MKNFALIREFYIAIHKMIRRAVPMQVLPMKVVSVDKEKATCVLKEEDSDQFEDVRLKSVIDDNNLGVVLYPKVGSYVLVGKIANDENNLTIIKINELESALISISDAFKCDLKPNGDLILNNGNNKGLVILDKAKSNLEKLKDYLDAVENGAGAIATALDSLVPGTSLTYNAITEPAKAACVFVDMENTKIKH